MKTKGFPKRAGKEKEEERRLCLLVPHVCKALKTNWLWDVGVGIRPGEVISEVSGTCRTACFCMVGLGRLLDTDGKDNICPFLQEGL